MRTIIRHPSSFAPRRRGIALLMVLLIVLAITVLAMGFLARADIELACGGNTLVRMQMDQLADSALEHARGLLLRPQDVPGACWTGATMQQLVAGGQDHDYYDVRIVRDFNRPSDYCTFDITCEAYRLVGNEKTGRSRLVAELRLDPAIALWTQGDLIFPKNWVLHGDVRSGGAVVNRAVKESLDGDVFSTALNGSIVGQHRAVHTLALAWPPVDANYMNPDYLDGPPLSGTLSNTAYQPARIWRAAGDLVLGSNVTIQGMLLVAGHLTVQGGANRIVAAKNLPALYVGGNLVIRDINDLQIEGLAVVDGEVRISAGASNINIVGGLFARGGVVETTADASGNGHTGLVCGNPQWDAGRWGGALALDGAGDYVNCGAEAALDIANQITVAAWINPKDVGNGEHNDYVAKGDYAYAIKHFQENYIEFFVYDASKPKQLGSGGWKSARLAVDAAFNGAWLHVAGTYDGSNVKLYVDGVLRDQVAYTGPIMLSPGTPLYIGANADWPTRFYEGAIDDVRIYNTALSEAALQDIMIGAPVPGNLVAHWKLDGPGSTVTIAADPLKTALVAWGWEGGILMPGQPWGQAAGSFFRSIRGQ